MPIRRRRRSPLPFPAPRRGRGLLLPIVIAAALPLGAPAGRADPSDAACLDANVPVTLSGTLQLVRLPSIHSPPHAAITYARLVLDHPLCLRDPFETDRDIFSVAVEPAPPPGHPPFATLSGHLIFNAVADHPPEEAVLFTADRSAR